MQSNQQQNRLWSKPKRFRSAFTTEQINYLETLFKKFPYIDRERRKEVAAILKMEERPIKIWFQNRRMKEKKEHKEFDVETNNSYPEELSKDQLNNVSAMSSTNGQQANSLPILTSIAAATAKINTYTMDINKDEHKITITNPENVANLNTDQASHPNASYYKETINQGCLSPYFQQQTNSTTSLFTNNVKNVSTPSQAYKSNTSAEFSINLWKKYKQKSAATNPAAYDNNINQEKKTKKMGPMLLPKGDTQHYSPPKDFATKKKPKVSYPAPAPSKPSQQVPLNNPAYYSVMPTLYTPPFMSPGGVIWNPVNFMPVMTTNAPTASITVANCQGPHEQSKNCKCNCHGSTQHVPITLPPSLQNPYTQYVINVPYQRTSP